MEYIKNHHVTTSTGSKVTSKNLDAIDSFSDDLSGLYMYIVYTLITFLFCLLASGASLPSSAAGAIFQYIYMYI